ncbi:MAG: double-strand break repair protein AddB, partial [Pseudomonadota bacterium]
SIWGTLEARLQTVDFLIMGGLNEGQWPSVPTNDPFVTRGMKSAMGMDPPERRIGLAAHDFQMGMGASQILITRATKRDGAPTVASRWVQRLETLAGEHARETMRARGQGFAELAAAVVSKARIKPLDPPTPKPPLVARPKRLSVTEVETLRRDPYAIYAKHTLRLRKLDPIMQEPDARTRGTLIHDCAEAIVKAQLDYASEEAVHRMIEIARAKFDEAGLPPDIDVIWWARMNAIIPELLYWERGRDAHIAKRFAELSAKAVELDDTGVVLGGRGDRFDLRADGRVDILDIKTGSHPSPKQVQKQFAPQLPLEAAMLERGAFRDISNTTPGDLIYVKLGSRGEVQPKVVGPWDVDEASKKKDLELTSTELAARDWNALVKLVKYYQDETKPYLSYPVPEKNRRWAGDYDHLARVAEWAGEDTHGEGGEDFS